MAIIKLLSLTRKKLRIGNQTITSTTPVSVDTSIPAVRRDMLNYRDEFIVAPGYTDAVVVVDAGGGGDFTTLQSALNSLPASGGRVLVKSGTYTLTTGITWPTNVTATQGFIIEGEGLTSRFLFDSSTVPVAFGPPNSTSRQNIVMRNMRISKTNAADGGTAIDWSYINSGTIEKMYIDNGGVGIGPAKCINITGVPAYYNKITQCKLVPGGSTTNYGVFLDNLANENTVDRLRIQANANTVGVYIGNVTSTGLYEIDVETGAAVGIDISGSAAATDIIGCYLEGNVINLRIGSQARVISVIGGKIAAASNFNIQDLGSNGARYVNVEKEYMPFNFSTRYGGTTATTGLANKRWVAPVYPGTASNLTGVTAKIWMHLFEIDEDVFVDGMQIAWGTVSGNCQVAIFGPTTTANGEENPGTCLKVVESASTATANPQLITLTKTYLRAGRYYGALVVDNSTAAPRSGTTTLNITDATVAYDRSVGAGKAGYGFPTTTMNSESLTKTSDSGFFFRLRCSPTFAII
jgi:hypothetical protein